MKFVEVDGLGPVSRIGLGTWQFGAREWGYGEEYASGAARDIVTRARALGVTLFDTAEVYGMGKSERILGEALGAERADVVVASKVFPVAPFPPVVKQRAQGERATTAARPHPALSDPPGEPTGARFGDHAGHAQPARRRCHRRGGRVELFTGPLAQGGCRAGSTGDQQPGHFSLAHPKALDDLVPFAERENRIVIAYSPLAQGLLGGKYGLDNRPSGVRATNPLFGTENLRRIEPLLNTLREVADDVGARPAQVALAWLISLPGVVAIPGASSVEQLEFNVAAADIDLSADTRDALTAAARAFEPVSIVKFASDALKEKLHRR